MQYLKDKIDSFRISGHRIQLYRSFAQALQNGAPLGEELKVKSERAFMRNKPYAKVLDRWWYKFQNTPSLATAIEGTVPDMDVMVIANAEHSGTLPDALAFLERIIVKLDDMKRALKSAITMPSLAMVIVLAVIVFVSFKGVPLLEQLIPPDKWPPAGKALRLVAHIVVRYGVFIFAGFIILFNLFIWSLSKWTGAARLKADNWFPYCVYRDYQGAIFLVVFAILIRAGVSIGDSLVVISEKGTPWIKWHTEMMQHRLQQAMAPATAMCTGMFQEDIEDAVIDFSRWANFDKALLQIGEEGIKLLEDRIKVWAGWVNVISMLMVGGSIAFVMLSLVMTAYSVKDSVM